MVASLCSAQAYESAINFSSAMWLAKRINKVIEIGSANASNTTKWCVTNKFFAAIALAHWVCWLALFFRSLVRCNCILNCIFIDMLLMLVPFAKSNTFFTATKRTSNSNSDDCLMSDENTIQIYRICFNDCVFYARCTVSISTWDRDQNAAFKNKRKSYISEQENNQMTRRLFCCALFIILFLLEDIFVFYDLWFIGIWNFSSGDFEKENSR